MILSGQVSNQYQAITALRGDFFNALRDFAPVAWEELCTFKDAYAEYLGASIRDPRTSRSFMFKPSVDRHHWRDDPSFVSYSNETQIHFGQHELFESLQCWGNRYVIQDTWVMEFALDWLRNMSLHPFSNATPSMVLGTPVFWKIPLHSEPPKLAAYDASWVSRDKYLNEAMVSLRQYCDDIEQEARRVGMVATKSHHSQALEWLVRFHFERETYEQVARDIGSSAVGQQVRDIAARLQFTYRVSRGRPKKRE